MADENQSRVGYKKPPTHSQFKKGMSGNRKGRPKGSRNLKTDLADELSEQIVVHEGGRTRRVSKQRALVKSLVARTLKGEVRPANMLLNLILRLTDPKAEEPREDESLTPQETEALEVIQKRLMKSVPPLQAAPQGKQK